MSEKDEDAKGDEPHVRFSMIDPQAEEERSSRGQQHRKDLVLGIRWHKETEKSIRLVQMKDGYDFIKNLNDFETLSKQSLGVKLTVEGFLAFFHSMFADTDGTEEDLQKLFTYFKESTKPVEQLGFRLQEHLIAIALHTSEDDYYFLPEVDTLVD